MWAKVRVRVGSGHRLASDGCRGNLVFCFLINMNNFSIVSYIPEEEESNTNIRRLQLCKKNTNKVIPVISITETPEISDNPDKHREWTLSWPHYNSKCEKKSRKKIALSSWNDIKKTLYNKYYLLAFCLLLRRLFLLCSKSYESEEMEYSGVLSELYTMYTDLRYCFCELVSFIQNYKAELHRKMSKGSKKLLEIREKNMNFSEVFVSHYLEVDDVNMEIYVELQDALLKKQPLLVSSAGYMSNFHNIKTNLCMDDRLESVLLYRRLNFHFQRIIKHIMEKTLPLRIWEVSSKQLSPERVLLETIREISAKLQNLDKPIIWAETHVHPELYLPITERNHTEEKITPEKSLGFNAESAHEYLVRERIKMFDRN